MSIALLTKLALFTIPGFIYATVTEPIDVDDLFRGRYDLDTLAERWDDIKIALTSCKDTRHPYNDHDVRDFLTKQTAKMQETELLFKQLGFDRSMHKGKKFTDVMMQEKSEKNIDEMINHLKKGIPKLQEVLARDLSVPKSDTIKILIDGLGIYTEQFMALRENLRKKIIASTPAPPLGQQPSNPLKPASKAPVGTPAPPKSFEWKEHLMAILAGCLVALLLLIGLVIYLLRS